MVTESRSAKDPSVCVVICAHSTERWALLQSAVASAVAEGPDEVIVVVDHNQALLQRAYATLDQSSESGLVRVISNSNQNGLSGARNEGIAGARSHIVAFIDDDAEAVPGWLTYLLQPFTDADVVAVGGRAIPARPERFPAWWPHEYDWVVGCSWSGLPESISDVRNVIGCSMAFQREALVALNGFLPELGRKGENAGGCEETELCIRLRLNQNGARIVYEPKATVLHHVDDRRLTLRYFLRRCWSEGRSKAVIQNKMGHVSLGPEKRFALEAIRTSIGTVIRATVRLDRDGLARSGAIIGGLVWTGLGFFTARFFQRDPQGSGRSPAALSPTVGNRPPRSASRI